MLGKKSENKIIFVKQSHRPSAHLVDLNLLGKKESDKKANGFFSEFADNLAGKAGFYFGKLWRLFKINQVKDENKILPKEELVKKAGIRSGRHFKIIKQLAFFPLIKFLFLAVYKSARLIYRVSYGLGWLVLFLIRFAFLFIWKIFVFTARLPAAVPHSVGSSFGAKETGVKSAPARAGPEFEKKSLADKDYAAKKVLLAKEDGGEIAGKASKRRRIWQPKIIIILAVLLAGLADRFARRGRAASGEGAKAGQEKKKLSFKPALIFGAFTLALILPVKAYLEIKDLYIMRERVLGVSQAAVNSLATASESARGFDFGQASRHLDDASASFAKAEAEIAEVSRIFEALAKVAPNSDLKLAANAGLILEAGRLSARIGARLMESLKKAPAGETIDVKIFFDNFYKNIAAAAADAGNLESVVFKIKADQLPGEYREIFAAVLEKTPVVAGSLREIADFLDKARLFLGFAADKRYLLVFQNNAEMRASGGFVGSFALVDVSQGRIKKIEAPGGGGYDTKGGLYERIISPEPLHLISPLWYFWDANWWPDWPKSARKLAWFYERSGGPTVDGVISFTPTVLERLLAIIGPVDLSEKYGVVFNADNFWLETQDITEERYKEIELELKQSVASSSAYTNANQPKRIIGDMLDKIMEILPQRLDKDTGLALIRLAENSLAEKHIMLNFYDSVLQNKAAALGWDGRVLDTAKDYLMVVHTNIAGGKSDRVMSEKIEQAAEVKPDGSVVVTLNIKRTHGGVKREKYTGVRNVDWLRIYAPRGSVLLEARGFLKPDEKHFKIAEEGSKPDPDLEKERAARVDGRSGTKIYEESGKTVFANWLMVDPGETVTVYLRYRLPFSVKPPAEAESLREKIAGILNPARKELASYSLFWQKQPGSRGFQFSSRLDLPDNFKAAWAYPESATAAPAGWNFSGDLATDKFYAVLIEINE